MNEDQFWRIVDGAASESGGNLNKRATALLTRLSSLAEDEIVQFDYVHTTLSFLAYRNDLWTAAHLVLSGCSDDFFLDFRYWLISRGRAAFYECLDNPDQVDRWMTGEDEVVIEELYGIIRDAFHAKSGRELPSRLPPGCVRPEAPVGPPIDLSEEAVMRRFPKLHARVRSMGPWPVEWEIEIS